MTKRTWIVLLVVLVLAGMAWMNLRGNAEVRADEDAGSTESIEQLTRQDKVVSYVQQHQRLPDYYITKKQARSAGWDARSGNLCDVLPGRAIGGDRFANREGRLPDKAKRVWREADINYRCGRRDADRLLYSSDGLIYVTKDHYRNFIRVE
ncbi:ribonuclease domain-containing protein [Enterobacillus tribolii]|uniref:Ribonuclease n=1 Tax=Enterobacillus tribolii TaxID=1487935 RepID=A0A370QQJ6_9GAMM|nr:ribonuclease domain-containing protein [Enterobacillus tribolii]MBW7981665.1 ribonuclease N [Enterobacillus tribolii]RDK91044.1 ribonuclease [Enterobacillus tribolii]